MYVLVQLKKMRAITRLKGVITPRIFGKGKKSIELETVVSAKLSAKNVFNLAQQTSFGMGEINLGGSIAMSSVEGCKPLLTLQAP
jgi:hypothetical protein